jgi:cytochrome c oxidase subunit III
LADSHTVEGAPDVVAEHALGHHFADMNQQRESSTLGMWVFLVTEIMFFGGLIAAYLIYRVAYPEAWHIGSSHMSFWLGTINTIILLCSSFTMAMAVWASQKGNNRLTMWLLVWTAILGIGFECVKGLEYYQHFVEGALPGPYWHLDVVNALHAQLFFLIYYTMTGLHALHLAIGIIIVLVLAYKAKKGAFTPYYHTPVHLTGLYWHFVDIVWVFLYPLLYLIPGAHGGGH